MEPTCDRRQGGRKEKPFGTLAYLKRHTESIHDPPIYCDKPFCAGRMAKGKKAKLNRGDKAEEHATRFHGKWGCSLCNRRTIQNVHYGFESEDVLKKHMLEAHYVGVGGLDPQASQ